MSGRDWYAEWLLGEMQHHIGTDFRIQQDGPDCFDTSIDTAEMEVYKRNADTLSEALAALYAAITGYQPPSRLTEDEVRAARLVIRSDSDPVSYLMDMAESDVSAHRMMARAVVEGP